MALSRRTGQRFQASIWPGFVDAMTGLLLVLMFVLTIFMVVQFVLRETISGQATELDALGAEVAALAQALGLEQRRSADLTTRLGELDATLGDARDQIAQQEALILSLRGERDAGLAALEAAETRITAFEAQVAALLSERDTALGTVAELEAEQGRLLSEQEALNLALAQARSEIDAGVEAARLAAARREALEALIADLRAEQAEAQEQVQALTGQVTTLEDQLSEEEAARLAEAAAAAALRDRLQNADSELTAMTLALEEQRARAEETLTLLAAAEAARDDLQAQLGAQMSEAEREAALLAQAQRLLAEEKDKSTEAQRAQALLNQQVAALRNQLGQLQALLDDSKERESAASIQVQSLGSDLNAALARAAAEERRRRQLEEAERLRLEAEAQDLQKYRSEFFGRLRDLLGNQPGVQVVGDRFVFASEVLFPPGSATLSAAGQGEVSKVASILQTVADEIPEGIDWVIQVNGHTDNVPLSGLGEFADNWELSQARALSVVRYMSGSLGIPPNRLSANGFGEYNPVNTADTEEARAQNRRIELKFTEK
ncbi:peptidoglycan -binding protein [Seohaeicola sp. SP36]|uniref:peptidoglycan -binding protein n=1 Tax=unclassified Seohaeicola TaxID=2641111 RepID=UPI00237A70CD|nr:MULTISPECIES: peptidoglycan -binding protein [unclassified Seohaeicola]MDD9706466.1 peptidoglycan -binding protein [Seohaeicola sp. 4SK31]MDD9733907.1 peptidoglycan -binding protein [Seohaeicola sp. SP36]